MTGHYPKKVAFVYPGIAYIGYGTYDLRLDSSDSDPIYAFSLLAALIAKEGYSFELIDLRQLKNEEELVQRFRLSDAPFVAITVQTPSFDVACEVAAIAKSLGKITIGGGVHATVMPDDFERHSAWDFVISGEGERSFLQLLDDLVHGRRPTRMIQGEVLDNLDTLPLPYLFPEWHRRYATSYAVEVARGCPGRCTYCISGEKKFYRKIRFRSVDHILREIDFVYNQWNFKTLLFLDVCASMNRKFFSSLLASLADRYSHLEVITQERVNTFNEHAAQQLARFSSSMVWFGFESASPRILKFIGKGTTIQQAEHAAEICSEYKLSIGANVLIGIPTETDWDIRQTYDFIKRIRPKMLFCNILSPFPGTQIHNYCEEKGILPQLDSYDRYELRHVLENGFIKGINYEKVRYWHWKFNSLIDLDKKPLWLRTAERMINYPMYRICRKIVPLVKGFRNNG